MRNQALERMAKRLIAESSKILAANKEDVEAARHHASPALLDRLTLNEMRITASADSLLAVSRQPDPLGGVIAEWNRPNGLHIRKISVPLGVVAVVYEARPNVTVDVAGLCLKSGNAAVLRGSSHAIRSNTALADVLRPALADSHLPPDALMLLTDTSREGALELMTLKGVVDLLVPRGGPALIASVEANARVPYILDGDGNCHIYVDRRADLQMAKSIVINAKTQRPGVCNAVETLLVHRDVAAAWLPGMLDELSHRGVEIRGDEITRSLWPGAIPADERDWATEYLDLILAVKVVSSLADAIAHVNLWSTSNAEAIVTEDSEAANRFATEVDSGTIFVNASTRFSDGGEFGYGSEIGISTQKLHARGPMGLGELTTYKFVVQGNGQVRE